MVYQVKFSRYNRKTSEHRISGAVHLNAKDFQDVTFISETRRQGMIDASPECDFAIVSILTHDYRGLDCEGGSRMFETPAEFSARVAEQAA